MHGRCSILFMIFTSLMATSNIIFVIILIAAVLASYKSGKLTLLGALTGGSIATALFFGIGFTGVAMLGAFFVLAVLATSHKKAQKRKLANESQKRDAWQVLANGGVAGALGLLAYLMPGYSLAFAMLVAASLASATADTLSSELGTVYGRRFYNIISFKPDEKGRDGVISLEGTVIGIAGSVIIAAIYAISFEWNIGFVYIIIAGTTGNFTDSLLGATLERKGYLNNNAVNLLNTVVAALIAWLLMSS